MSNGFTSTLRPVLAAPWQQRRNTGSMWGVVIVACMLALAPVLLFGWSLYMQWGAPKTPAGALPLAVIAREIRHTAANTGLWALAAALLAVWATLVSNLLDQNRPVLARLVPHHPARLRTALLVAWVAMVAAITLLIGVRFDAPLACATAASAALAILAASVRWPMLWILGCIAPMAVGWGSMWPGLPHAIDVAGGVWREQAMAIFLTLGAASAVLLVALIQAGGAGHVASDETRRRRVQRFVMRAQGGQPVAVGTRGCIDALLTRPYHAWWRHALARPASPAFSRLMLGLGPGVHWTASAAAVSACALALFAGLVVLQLAGLVYPPAARVAPDMLAGFSIGLVFALLSPAIQVQGRLHQSRREQALLVLLPGVPRGAALSRRLAWQLTGQFLVAWVGAVALAALCLATAHALRAQAVHPLLLDLVEFFAITAMTMMVFQWRPWSRVGAPTGLAAIGPLLLPALAGLAIWVGPDFGWGTHAGVSALSLAATAAWCALRWRRMGREPSALPVGRLA